MRLRKRLLVNGRPYPLATDYVRLRLSQVGEGIFELLETPRSLTRALAEFYVGVGDSEEYLVLTGAVTGSQQMAAGRLRLEVRELCTVLERTVILNMERCTPRDLIAKLERETGLRFLLPAGAAYLDDRHVRFRHYGPGVDALSVAASLWEIPDAVWLQLPDGRMYWGHWAQGPYSKAPLPIEAKLILERDAERRTLVLPYIPALRPGMVIQTDFRFRIDAIIFSGDTARITWAAV